MAYELMIDALGNVHAGNKKYHTNNLVLHTGSQLLDIDGVPINVIRGDTNNNITGYLNSQAFINQDSNLIRMLYPTGASYTSKGNITGAMKIMLPVGYTNTMLRLTVSVFDYLTGASFDIHISGYNYTGTPGWVNTTAYIVGSVSTDQNLKVRFGYDGSKCIIYIGELTSTWQYLKYAINNVLITNGDTIITDWYKNWSCGVETNSFLNITNTKVADKIGKRVSGNIVWHAGNDGSGSGLDADLLDGLDSTQFARTDITEVFNKSIGIGTTPGNTFNNGKAIAFGDNDTGIRQSKDGVLELWANNVNTATITPGVLSASRIAVGFDAGIGGGVSASNWFRSNGATGWFNQTYGGGINMTDSTWVRISHGKQFLVDNIAQVKTRLEITEPAANAWKYLRLQTGTTPEWDISTKADDTSGALQFRPNGVAANHMYLEKAGNLHITGNAQAIGTSTSWGTNNGGYTGAFNAVMGTATSATWLLSGTSGGVVRYGIQVLDKGGPVRYYTAGDFIQQQGSTLSHVTEISDVSNITFHAEGSDSASISTTINGSGTYFDFNLSDDNNNDWWRWRFTPSGSTVYDAMKLVPYANGKSKLTVSGQLSIGASGYFFNDSGTRLAYAGGEFYIQNTVPTTYIYSPTIFLGNTTGTIIHLRASTIDGNGWSMTGTGDMTANSLHLIQDNANSAALDFDSDKHKNITTNDGTGNFNIKSGILPNNNQYLATDGAAQITLDSDGLDGAVSLGVARIGHNATNTAANFTSALQITDGINGLKWTMGNSIAVDNLATRYTVWHAGNDGAGSGLDADLLDGLDSTYFTRSRSFATGTAGTDGAHHWMTVASISSGRHHGTVIVSDQASSHHTYIEIDWLQSYDDSNITVINVGGLGKNIIGARVLYATNDLTYGIKLLQVLVTNKIAFDVRVIGNTANPGWGYPTAVTPLIEDTKSGYAVLGPTITDLDKVSLAAQKGIATGGLLRFIGTPTGTDQNLGIYWNAFDKELSTDYSDYASIRQTVNAGGLTGTVLEIIQMNDSNDGVAVMTGSNIGFKHNSHTVWTQGNDGSGSGLDADLVRGLPADFTSSKATNGYQKLPSGLIIQWGVYGSVGNGTTSSSLTVNFPISFPNYCLNVSLTPTSTTTGSFSVDYISVMSWNTTSWTTDTDYFQGYMWIAIGY